LSLTIVTLLFAGCSKENDDSIEDFSSKYVSINATMGLSTKATATAFESGDVIGVYAWTGSGETITAGTEKKIMDMLVLFGQHLILCHGLI